MGNICSASRHSSDGPSIYEMLEARERGQDLLRSMVLESNDIDWETVIRTADQLVEHEQTLLKNLKKKDRKLFQKQALKMRKQHDASGSFSVNLLTYRLEGDDQSDPTHTKSDYRHTSPAFSYAMESIDEGTETSTQGDIFEF